MLKAGFARVEVTPPLGNPLHGYFKIRVSDGILDELELNALAIGNGTATAIVITSDFLGIMLDVANTIRKNISECTGVPVDSIFVQALHQHTSVRLGARNDRVSQLSDTEYIDVLMRKFCDVAKMAIDDMDECEMSVTFKETDEQISFVRRFKMKDGSTRTNPGCLNPDIVGPASEADNTVRLVKFEREFKNDIALVNFSTHPDVISGCKYSADWPGFVREFVEKDIEGVSCIVVNGAQGDVNHIDVTKKIDKDPAARYALSQHMARVITDTVLDIWDWAEPCEGEDISGRFAIINTATNTAGIEHIEEYQKIMDAHYAGTLEQKLSLDKLGEYGRITGLLDESLFQRVPLSVIKVGDLVLVGFGGEPFTEYATYARAAAPDKFVISACCTNGYQGYIPSEAAFNEGGYEARSSRFSPDVVTSLRQNIKEMLK